MPLTGTPTNAANTELNLDKPYLAMLWELMLSISTASLQSIVDTLSGTVETVYNWVFFPSGACICLILNIHTDIATGSKHKVEPL